MTDIIFEYKKLLATKLEIEQKLSVLPKGYISKKTIGGKQYLYLQTRNGDTVESKYIKAEEADEITNQISLRKEYEAQLPEILIRLADIETAAELLDKALLRKLNMLKLTSGMDSISVDEKAKRISFSDAMTSIEGVPVSDRVKKDLANWRNGNITFLSVFEQTLRRYGFVTEV
ncbi:MAG: hypothetical protein UHM16_06320 [Acutalibacteraceae bacterium]|nr:hypothetical protein [Acutalibacteraceae bacterium]